MPFADRVTKDVDSMFTSASDTEGVIFPDPAVLVKEDGTETNISVIFTDYSMEGNMQSRVYRVPISLDVVRGDTIEYEIDGETTFWRVQNVRANDRGLKHIHTLRSVGKA